MIGPTREAVFGVLRIDNSCALFAARDALLRASKVVIGEVDASNGPGLMGGGGSWCGFTRKAVCASRGGMAICMALGAAGLYCPDSGGGPNAGCRTPIGCIPVLTGTPRREGSTNIPEDACDGGMAWK